jgi:hypothetical protein
MTTTLGLWMLVFSPALAQPADPPRFEDYPVTGTFTGKPAEPIPATPERRLYRSRIRNGFSTGAGVWNGRGSNRIKRKDPNFAGHSFVIRWGCGSKCGMMATVDANTGVVYDPPLSGATAACLSYGTLAGILGIGIVAVFIISTGLTIASSW